MKIIFKFIKKICLGFFALYSLNIVFSNIDFNIPINAFSIFLSSFLGIFGMMAMIIFKLFI